MMSHCECTEVELELALVAIYDSLARGYCPRRQEVSDARELVTFEWAW